MRISIIALLLAATPVAQADPPREIWVEEPIPYELPPDRRNAATVEYDAAVCAWRRALGARVAADADPDIAWAGAVIAAQETCRDEHAPPARLPEPATGAGRLMWHEYCARTQRCEGTLVRWRAAEPGNLFVLGLSAEARTSGTDSDDGDDEQTCGREVGEFSGATRYDDHYAPTRALAASVVERYGFVPPTAPADFDAQTSETFYARSADFFQPDTVLRGALEEIRDDYATSDVERLRLAQMLIAVKNSPYAAQYGAQLGAKAATDAADRDRYCRLALRGIAVDEAIDAMVLDGTGSLAAREFHRLLRDGNGVDAIEAVAASLPLALRPKPVDPVHVAVCVLHGPGFEVEDYVAEQRYAGGNVD
ncbi:hypothetical protein [Tahibacter soli]|uniref:Uncharacterized protein n=1 Tax=Tahibacter soli TaxID=2983605 RepID=A0A9X3YMH7_9GAMM|nr:hypothetical protein [Tahibacter soli]MDC8013456.1 hypothetical protein [Tahibacter soli]